MSRVVPRIILRTNSTCMLKTSSARSLTCGPGCKENAKLEMDPGCKVALITGGATGIGFAIANQLLKAGAKAVAITGIDSCQGKEAVHKLNGLFGTNRSVFINSSVTCMSQFEESFKTVTKMFKHLDIVINCAGILDGKNWEKEMVTNIIGTVRGTLLAYRYIGREGGGKGGVVINIAGVSGIEPLPPAPTYSACQHGIVGLSRSFGDAMHVAKSGVRVCQLLAGCTRTDLYKNVEKKGMTDFLGTELHNWVEKAKKQTPDAVGQAAVHVIKCGPSGSVWLVEGSRLFDLKIPEWQTFSTLAAQYI